MICIFAVVKITLITNKNQFMYKKDYLQPSLQIVELCRQSALLAGSATLNVDFPEEDFAREFLSEDVSEFNSFMED